MAPVRAISRARREPSPDPDAGQHDPGSAPAPSRAPAASRSARALATASPDVGAAPAAPAPAVATRVSQVLTASARAISRVPSQPSPDRSGHDEPDAAPSRAGEPRSTHHRRGPGGHHRRTDRRASADGDRPAGDAYARRAVRALPGHSSDRARTRADCSRRKDWTAARGPAATVDRAGRGRRSGGRARRSDCGSANGRSRRR